MLNLPIDKTPKKDPIARWTRERKAGMKLLVMRR
jgi:hypothetical protein